jgi:GntP family gluconate:H+ symporter
LKIPIFMKMDPLPAFVITLALISIVGIRFRISPFFTLVGGALFFGVLTGIPPEQIIQAVTGGLARVFGLFAIVILSGAVIAKTLEEQGQIVQIVADIRNYAKNPVSLTGVSSYLLALPVACSITAFIILEPVMRNLEEREKEIHVLLFVAALGSLISFGLLYPTPVTIPLFATLADGSSPLVYDLLAIPLSLVLLGGILIFSRNGGVSGSMPEGGGSDPAGETARQGTKIHLRAWAPLLAIAGTIPVAWALGLSPNSLVQVIMLAGAVTALVLAPEALRLPGIHKGAKHAGVIIFDICGAGALAAIILESGFTEAVLGGVTGIVPILFIPFVIAALIQTAQGSRVVTAVITGGILAGSPIASFFDPLALILMIVAGTFLFSYVTDPYFWIVQKATGETIGGVIRRYTLPLALCGVVIFAVAVILQILVSAA